MKISRFDFQNKEKNNREKSPTRNRRSRAFLQHFRGADCCSRRWYTELQRRLQAVVLQFTKTERSNGCDCRWSTAAL